MATVNKDFKVKHGLIVQGTTGTINGNNILTDANTTDVLDEGTTNLYYTDSRVKDVIAGATKENIDITVGTDGTLFITAENGVGDSTTDDLVEGTSNLYWTEGRSRDSISGGDGIAYDSETGVVSVDYGYGLKIDETDKLAVDTDDIATKEYVDEVAQGLKVRGSVEAATTANLTGTYNNGTNGVDATLTLAASATLNIDGWDSWSEGDGILVKDQDNAEENGRYFIFVAGDAGTAWVLKRCIDCDTAEEIAGSFVFVQHGTTYGATGWVATVNNSDTFEVGTDAITWVQFSGAGTYLGGTGIEVDGTDISIDFTEFDTDNIDEGTTRLYYTDQKVKDVLTNSTQENISITTGTDGVLFITAENGVDDSTTADLAEDPLGTGTSGTWYFTNQRAVDALEAVVPDFDAVEISSIAKQIAATATLTTAEVVGTVYSFAHADYRAAKFLIKMAAGSHTEVVEVLLTLDTSNNVAITEYAIVGTNGAMGVVSATVSGNDVLLTVNPNNSNTTVRVYGTLLV